MDCLSYTQDNYYQDKIFVENERCFRNIDRHIKSKILNKHRDCVRIFQELKKEEGVNYPPICPFAYAYVFWKHTLLKTDQFYTEGRNEEDRKVRRYSRLEFATCSIQPYLIDILKKIVDNNYFSESLVHWILNRFTSDFCLNYFYQWLEIAMSHSGKITTPSWSEVLEMIESSLPKSIYKIQFDGRLNLTVELFTSSNMINLENLKCDLSAKHMRKLNRRTKSMTPMTAVMRIFDNPSIENKQLRDYVNAYVSRLRI